MLFKEMKPEDVWKELEGQENVISPEMKKLEEYFSKLRCHRCRGCCHPVVKNTSLFKTGEILPDFLAECSACGTVFTPYTMIEVSGPTKDPHAED